MVSPADENNLSDGADVAVMQSRALATLEIRGYLALWDFHHINGSLYTQLPPTLYLIKSGGSKANVDNSASMRTPSSITVKATAALPRKKPFRMSYKNRFIIRFCSSCCTLWHSWCFNLQFIGELAEVVMLLTSMSISKSGSSVQLAATKLRFADLISSFSSSPPLPLLPRHQSTDRYHCAYNICNKVLFLLHPTQLNLLFIPSNCVPQRQCY